MRELNSTYANTPNRCATSSTPERQVFWPSPPWQCFFLDASPGAYTDAASPNHNATLLALLLPASGDQRVAVLANVSQPLMSGTGIFTGNEPKVAAELLGTDPIKSSKPANGEQFCAIAAAVATGVGTEDRA